MPAGVVGAILTAGKIAGAISSIIGLIQQVNQIKQSFKMQIKVELNVYWQGQGGDKNPDSQIFNQRLDELDQDILRLTQILDEYIQLLGRIKTDLENTQGQTVSGASALRSPRNS
jgi:hypothetical protein